MSHGASSAVTVEIVGPDGSVHYRRPAGHPLIREAAARPGYTVRGGPAGHPDSCKRHEQPGGFYDFKCPSCAWSGCSGWCDSDSESVWCPVCGGES